MVMTWDSWCKYIKVLQIQHELFRYFISLDASKCDTIIHKFLVEIITGEELTLANCDITSLYSDLLRN